MRTILSALPFSCLVLVLAAGCGATKSPTAPDQSGVPYSQTDLQVGTGAEAVAGKQVVVGYTGWLYSESATDHKGTPFDANTAFPFQLGVRAVIAGWDQGIVGMKVGGVRRLVIPPSLAYGATGNGPIPPNAALVFDVQLVSVQ